MRDIFGGIDLFGHEAEERLLRDILEELKAIKRILRSEEDVRSISIIQKGGNNMAVVVGNVGVNAGSKGTFVAVPVPGNASFLKPPSIVSDNPLAVVSMNPSDPSGATVDVAVDASATGSFNLSASYTNADGDVATGTLNVPINTVAPPPVDVTSITIQQIA